MKISLNSKLACGLISTLIGLSAGSAFAHDDNPVSQGNWQNISKHFWKDNSGHCWRAGYWTPSMAVAECDPDLVKKPEKKETKPETPPAALIPNLGPDAPALRVTIQAEALFDFDKAVLRADGKKTLDEEVVGKMKAHPEVEVLLVTGYADRIGSEKYNQKLSEKRAHAVKAYLVEQGVEDKRIEAVGKGESDPVVDCKDIKGRESRHNKKLVECLQPNRRVVAEVKVQAPLK